MTIDRLAVWFLSSRDVPHLGAAQMTLSALVTLAREDATQAWRWQRGRGFMIMRDEWPINARSGDGSDDRPSGSQLSAHGHAGDLMFFTQKLQNPNDRRHFFCGEMIENAIKDQRHALLLGRGLDGCEAQRQCRQITIAGWQVNEGDGLRR